MAQRGESTPRTNSSLSTSGLFIFINSISNSTESMNEILNTNQVWICLGISLVVLTSVLTFLMSFHRKFVYKKNVPPQQPSPGRNLSIDFSSLGRNGLYFWSHLTNQGIIAKYKYSINILLDNCLMK